MDSSKGVVFAVLVLLAINTMNFYDRTVLGALAEPVRKEFGLSDTQLGWLTTTFTLMYAAVGVPLGRLADSWNRTRILAVGVFVWSLLTGASGLARTYWQLFTVRIGVGLGEASCAPAASSLIGDLVPASGRARAISVFMLGLPLGNALSFAVSGPVAKHYGWRSALLVACLPGLICAVLALFIREPQRGGTETHGVGTRRRPGNPYLLVLSIPTVWWLILSGALHNFNMYTLGSFLSPMLTRVHGLDLSQASTVTTFVYGLSGIPGLLVGGVVGDWLRRRRIDGRLLLGGVALALSVPLIYFGLSRPVGDVARLAWLMGTGCGVMYVYYSVVYSTLQDVVEPALRGTAMALYFFAMYVLGASLGPVVTGWMSDHFARQAAVAAGVQEFTAAALEPYRGAGLHSAMYVIPLLNIALAVVLLAGSRTVGRDATRLEQWMRENAR